MTETIKEIALTKIRWNSGERKKAELDPVVEVLTASITDNGLIEPIILKKDMTFISGRKRAVAYERLNFVKIPAIIREYPAGGLNRPKMAEIAENLHRSHLGKPERDALLGEYTQLLSKASQGKKGWGKSAAVAQAAKEAGVSRRTVQRAVKDGDPVKPEPSGPALPKDFNVFGLDLDDTEIARVNAAAKSYADAMVAVQSAEGSLKILAANGLIEPAKAQRLYRELQAVLNDLKSGSPVALCPSCKMLDIVMQACGSCFGSGLAGKAMLAGVDRALLLSGAKAVYVDAQGEQRRMKG